MTKPIYVSPSQIKTWRDCPRKWAFDKINRIRSPSTPKQKFGTDCHTIQENWLSNGVLPPETSHGRVCKQSIRDGWLPTPGPDNKVEYKFSIKVAPGIFITGFVDCAREDGLVIDHKFTSALKWAMTEDELLTDPQGIMYAYAAMHDFGISEVDCRWVYCAFGWPGKAGEDCSKNATPKGARKVEAHFSKNDPAFLKQWDAIMADVMDIAEAKKSYKDANEDAAANTSSCSKFGGCYYQKQGLCKIPKLSLGSRMKQRVDKTGENPIKDDAMGSIKDRLKKMSATADSGKNPLKQQAAEVATNDPLLDKIRATAGDEKGINPPARDESETPEPEIVEAVAPTPTPEKTKEKKKAAATTPSSRKKGATKSPAKFTVLFNALPSKQNGTPSQHLIDVLRPVMNELCDAKDVMHWALIDHYVDGRALLQEGLRHAFQEKKPEGFLIVDVDTPEAKAVYDVLVEFADEVVQGVR